MIFVNDTRYVKVWEVTHYEKHTKLQVSTGEKKQDGNYENSGWYLTLVGQAFEQGRHLKKGDTITVNKGKLTNIYNKDKKQSYLNFVAFDIEAPSYQQNQQSYQHTNSQDDFCGFQAIDSSDEIPF